MANASTVQCIHADQSALCAQFMQKHPRQTDSFEIVYGMMTQGLEWLTWAIIVAVPV